MTCPLCGSSQTRIFLRRDEVPVHQNVICRTAAEARAASRGTLQMAICARCEFVFNAAFDPSRIRYAAEYDNEQSFSPHFSRYIDGIIDELRGRISPGSLVVEVGCGKGVFLRRLVERAPDLRAIGFDPTYVGASEECGGRLRFEARPFDETLDETVDAAADAVICRHVIEHVPRPVELIRSIRAAVARRPAIPLFIETPCVDWILTTGAWWDFFYEHCSLFNERSLVALLAETGFATRRVQHRFGGQYLWLEAVTSSSPPAVRGDLSRSTLDLAASYARNEADFMSAWQRRRKSIAVWGAGAKGVTFVNLLDPRGEWIDCVVDLNPRKQGGYVAGSAHPIVAPHAIRERAVRRAVIMNPNYRDEIVDSLRASATELDLLSL